MDDVVEFLSRDDNAKKLLKNIVSKHGYSGICIVVTTSSLDHKRSIRPSVYIGNSDIVMPIPIYQADPDIPNSLGYQVTIDDALVNNENTFDWSDVLLKQMFKHKDGVGYVAQHEYAIFDQYLQDYRPIIRKGILIEELLVENDLCM